MDRNSVTNIFDFGNIPMNNEEENVVLEPFVPTPIVSNPDNRELDIDVDYAMYRGYLNSLIQQSTELAKITLESARNSDSPKFKETAASVIKSAVESVEKGILLHKKMNEIKGTGKTVAVKEVKESKKEDDKDVFFGTPNDMIEDIEAEENNLSVGD